MPSLNPPTLPKVVLFDLLTALLDSWTLWNRVAGSEAAGRAWRAEYLRLTYGCGAYVPYEDLVRTAARTTGLRETVADALETRWHELPGVERRADRARCAAGPHEACRGDQLLGSAGRTGGSTPRHALGLHRHGRGGGLLQARPAPLSPRAGEARYQGSGCGVRCGLGPRSLRHVRRRPPYLLAQQGWSCAARRRARRFPRAADAGKSCSLARRTFA